MRSGWLKLVNRSKVRGGPKVPHYESTADGRAALAKVQERLRELQREVFADKKRS
jgi:DNA-binding PadR family transcriptional regulator